MLHDFSFKIMHCSGFKHSNVDTLSRNHVGHAKEDDFLGEIQDCN
jgi:hypothetical protein